MKNEDWCLWPSELNGVPAVSRSRVNNNKIFVTKTAISSAKTTKLEPLPPTAFAVLFPSDFVFCLSLIVLESETRVSCPQSNMSQ